MKNNLIVIAVVVVSTISSFSQVAWTKKGGLWAYDYGYGVVTDANNNVYVAGKFEMNAVFGSFTASCQGNHDAYIIKYGADGSEKWFRTAGGADGDYAWGISTDRNNYLFVAGEIEGLTPVIFSGSTVTLQGAGDNDVFVSKYDLDGNVLWAKREGTTASEKALSVANDVNGNVYICGYFTDNSNFNGVALPGFGGRDIFVAKYDPQGNFLWVQKAGGTGRDEAKCIKTDNNGNLYICGMFSSNAVFGAISLSAADNYQDSYVAKLSGNDGSFIWVKKGDAVLDDVAWSLAVDNAGNLYATGEFNSYISFQNPPAGLATTGNTNIYITKFDGAGTVQWIRGGGGNLSDRARGIGTDGYSVFVTGQFGGVANFGPHSLVAADSSDVFIAAMDANGGFLWALAGGGPPDSFEPLGYESGIAVTANNNIVYATGGMLNDANITNSTFIDFAGNALSGYSRDDMFLVAVGSNGVGIGEEAGLTDFKSYPNPVRDIIHYHSRVTIEMISVTDVSGKMALQISGEGRNETVLDLREQKNGIYFSSIFLSSGEVIHHKILLQH